MTNNKKQVTVGLLWHSLSSDNLGVGALTESQIAICNAAAEKVGVAVRYIIFGTKGGSSYVPDGVDIKIGSRISIKQMLKGTSEYLNEIQQCDFLLDIGEGDSFTDIYGWRGLAVHMASKCGAIYKKRRLILSPQTIGPFNGFFARHLAIAIMKRAEKIYARDQMSKAFLTECGLNQNTDEAIDVAFRLPFSSLGIRDEGKINVGINVSGLLYSGGYTGNNQFGLSLDYKKLTDDLISYWLKDENCVVWLIPHVIPDNLPNDDDRIAISKILDNIKNPRLKTSGEFKSPSQAKSFISEMDFLTGARMHACIAAFSSGVPVVPMAYSRKFNGLFTSLNYDWFVDGRADSNDEAFRKITRGFHERCLLKELIAQGNKIAEEKLMRYECYVSELMLTSR